MASLERDQVSESVGPESHTAAQSQGRTKAKGLTRLDAVRGLEYFMDSTKTWVPAIYHEDIRAKLIMEASQKGAYVHPRKSGLGGTDITAFLPEQKSWGGKRDDWPAILFVLDIKKAPRPTPALPMKVPLWYREGKVVLDRSGNPMRDFPTTIPATCSSVMEDWLLVAILHTDTRIQIGDIHGRMPNEVALAENEGTIPLFGANTLSMRMTRFRLEAGLLPREQRCGSGTLKEGYKNVLGERCFTENSTRSFGRKLSQQEISILKQHNKDKFGLKAKNKNQSFHAEESSNIETKTDIMMGGRTTGVLAAVNNHQETNAEFLRRMFPNLYRAVDGASTHRKDSDAGLGISLDGQLDSIEEPFETDAGFVATTYHEQYPTKETGMGDGTPKTQLGNFGTGPSPSQNNHSSSLERTLETHAEFIARVFPTPIPNLETGVSDITMSPWNGVTSQDRRERRAHRGVTTHYSSTSETAAHGHGYPIQGARLGSYEMRPPLIPVPTTPRQNDGEAFANTNPLIHQNHFAYSTDPGDSTTEIPPNNRKRSAPDTTSRDSATETPSKRQKRSAPNTNPSASAIKTRSKRQSRSSSSANPGASATRTRSIHQTRLNPDFDFFAPDSNMVNPVEGTQSDHQSHFTSYAIPGMSADGIQSHVTPNTNQCPQFMWQPVYPDPAEIDQLYPGPWNLGPYGLNKTAQSATLEPHYMQSFTTPSPVGAELQNGVILAGEDELGQFPSPPSQPTMLAEDFLRFTHEMALDPAMAEVMGLTERSSILPGLSAVDAYPPVIADLGGFEPTAPGANNHGLPLFGPDGYPLFEAIEANTKWDFLE